MASETDIANVAIGHVGGTVITNLTDGSKNANAVNNIFTEVRDGLLRSHLWNFATKRVKLAQSTTAPAHEFDHAYPVPADWLRTLRVSNNDAGSGPVLYRAEQVAGQAALVTSSDDLWLTYIARETDPNLMTADFRVAFEFALARDIAIPIAGSATLRVELVKTAKSTLAQARSTDAMGGFPESRPRGSWAQSRRGWRSQSPFEGD
jgi:hypothetical protein